MKKPESDLDGKTTMLRILLPLTFAGFVIFVMVDSQKRFKILKEKDPEDEKHYTITHALMMTLMVMFTLYLFAAAGNGFNQHFPSVWSSMSKKLKISK